MIPVSGTDIWSTILTAPVHFSLLIPVMSHCSRHLLPDYFHLPWLATKIQVPMHTFIRQTCLSRPSTTGAVFLVSVHPFISECTQIRPAFLLENPWLQILAGWSPGAAKSRHGRATYFHLLMHQRRMLTHSSVLPG